MQKKCIKFKCTPSQKALGSNHNFSHIVQALRNVTENINLKIALGIA